jgi:hypothetical protein
MGAMCWQIVHQNSKNSTSCSPPEAILTVVGSVASKWDPREVATGNGVGASVSTGVTVACTEGFIVAVGGGRVRLGSTSTGCAGGGVELAGVQVTNNTASRMRLEKKRNLIFQDL